MTSDCCVTATVPQCLSCNGLTCSLSSSSGRLWWCLGPELKPVWLRPLRLSIFGLLLTTHFARRQSISPVRGMATASAAEERSNPWHGPRIVQTTRRISDLCESRQLQDVLRFVAISLVWQPERERRLLSHFGFIQGLDWGNIVYAITYRKLLEYASPRCPYMNYARNFFQSEQLWQPHRSIACHSGASPIESTMVRKPPTIWRFSFLAKIGQRKSRSREPATMFLASLATHSSSALISSPP